MSLHAHTWRHHLPGMPQAHARPVTNGMGWVGGGVAGMGWGGSFGVISQVGSFAGAAHLLHVNGDVLKHAR